MTTGTGRVVFFVDRSLGRLAVDRLRAAGVEVEAHHEHFADDAPDEEWLAAVGRNAWIALSADKRIRHRPREIAAVRRHGVRLFVLASGNLSGSEQANLLVGTLPKMLLMIRERAPSKAGSIGSTFGGKWIRCRAATRIT